MESEPDIAQGPGTAENVVAVRGCVPTAAITIDARGTILHWGAGARALFGHRRQHAVGMPAGEILPVTGALNAAARPGDHHWLDGAGDLAGAGDLMAGRARVTAGADRADTAGRADVLWWAYPLPAPSSARLLVLAVDAARLQRQRGLRGARFAPGFGPHRWFPEAAELAARLPGMLGRPGREAAARLVARVLKLGCPVLEVSRPLLLDDPALAALNAQVSGRCG
ncbi:PAS domain-containing protein [Streptomyces axinellae]|uniref:PAS domain-containing protein n=1 Tax=Streptomyces axinellae TaxID=552788 RepID=A0ABN3QHM9_9ACTN